MSHHASLCMPWTAVAPNSGRSMTTSSFDGNRCNRISPSAVLDDRLDGKDLEWARDHLRRCEACRDRVEDFREMLLRVGRLPSASVGAAAMDQAFAVAIPDRFRAETGGRSFEIASSGTTPTASPLPEFPLTMRPEVSSVPDLLIELEREIFRDEPGQDHPTPLTPIPESTHPMMAEPPVEEIDALAPQEDAEPQGEFISELPLMPAVPEVLPGPLREVPVDSHREPEPVVWDLEPEPATAAPEPELELDAWHQPPEAIAAPESSNVVFDQEPALRFDEEVAPATPPRRSDTAMRLAVGLGAA